MPLFVQKSAPGLFGAGAAARQAAEKCKELELLQVVRSAPRGKAPQEVVVLTPKGMEHLLISSSPKLVLEDLLRALEQRNKQLDGLIESVRASQASICTFKEQVAAALSNLDNGPTASAAKIDRIIQQALATFGESSIGEDCPLPRLLRDARVSEPLLSVGAFHDSLRRLHDRQAIYLHPWTGPLSELPDPTVALLVGHEISFYASLRTGF
jgi:hypothetical protein